MPDHLVLVLVVDVHLVVDEQLVLADRALLLGGAAADLKGEIRSCYKQKDFTITYVLFCYTNLHYNCTVAVPYIIFRH